MIRRFSFFGTGQREVGAEFELVGDQLRIDWKMDGARRMLERGIFVPGAGELFPKDGRAFFDALPLAFSQSSFVRIEDV